MSLNRVTSSLVFFQPVSMCDILLRNFSFGMFPSCTYRVVFANIVYIENLQAITDITFPFWSSDQ